MALRALFTDNKKFIHSFIHSFNFQEFSGKELMRRTNALGTVVAKEAKDLSELRNLHEQQGVELRKFHEEQGVRMDQLCELCLSFETTLANIDGKLDGLAESFANRAADPGAPPQERAERDPQLGSIGTFLSIYISPL